MFERCLIPTRFSKRSLFVLVNISLGLLLSFHLLFTKKIEVDKLIKNFITLPQNKMDMIDLNNWPIEKNTYPNLIEKFSVPRKNSSHLPRKMFKKDYDTLIQLLNLTLSVLDENDIPYTVSAGGLVGSYVRARLFIFSNYTKTVWLFTVKLHYFFFFLNQFLKTSLSLSVSKLICNTDESFNKLIFILNKESTLISVRSQTAFVLAFTRKLCMQKQIAELLKVMHDLLPWDDDMDIMINYETKDKVIHLFEDDRHHGIKGLLTRQWNGVFMKLFFTNSIKTGK